jgi:hypothetical protein
LRATAATPHGHNPAACSFDITSGSPPLAGKRTY